MKKEDIIKKLEAAGIEAPEGATNAQLSALLPAKDAQEPVTDSKAEQLDETSDTESVVTPPEGEEKPKEQGAPKLVTVECAAVSLFEDGARYSKGDEIQLTEERAASLGNLVTAL